MTLDKLLTGVRALGLTLTLSGCAAMGGRPYTGQNARQNAYLNMTDMLAELCCTSLGDSYPNCRTFRIDKKGFHCEQMNFERQVMTSHFNWEEIEQVECTGRAVHIQGKYDSSEIYARGPVWKKELKQCRALAEAISIYLRER